MVRCELSKISRLRSLTGQSLSRAGEISSCVNGLSAREKIGPVNEPLTSQSTCLFNRFAPLFGEVTIGRLTEQNPQAMKIPLIGVPLSFRGQLDEICPHSVSGLRAL